MYVVALVFFGFAVRKYKDHYIPAALSMVAWFLLSAVIARPGAAVMGHLDLLRALEKLTFTVMTVLLLWHCILRKKPLRLDWFPLVATLLAAAIRLGWFVFFQFFDWQTILDPVIRQRMVLIQNWKDFVLQATLSAVAVWHIYWMSRPRFIK